MPPAPWRVARSILILRDEIDDKWPDRAKLSDGTIGNAAHASRASDHNAWVIDRNSIGVVTALDITHDPENGPDLGELAEFLRDLGKSGDKRVKYVIWNRRISSRTKEWAWREYKGPNAHVKHLHLSVSPDPEIYDVRAPWLPVPPTPDREQEEIELFLGLYPSDGRVFLCGVDGKRLVPPELVAEFERLGIPKKKVSGRLLNLLPTLPAPRT